ncbi:MAG: tryptophanase [Eubacteriaceae bacterium]
MKDIKFFTTTEQIPLELHKAYIVQKLNFPPIERRLQAINEAGNNSFLLNNTDIFLDMLTDSGVNAMSDRQIAAMMTAEDSYAGSATFTRLRDKIEEIFKTPFFLPAHQGRACENILSMVFVKPGDIVPMNYHFTTTKEHIARNGGAVAELVIDEGLNIESDFPFKGNFDLEKLENLILDNGADKIPFVRLEAGTNLIGGQPFSLENAMDVASLCRKHGILTVLDASLLQDNLFFMKQREEACKNMSILQITHKLADEMDIIYFSARKLGFARGGGICMRDKRLFEKMKELIPLFEGFLTYGGMSVREMEILTVGLDETMDEDIISQGPQFIKFMTDELKKAGVPVVTPAGGLGCHLDAKAFLPHVPQDKYPAGSLVSALYIASGVRGMERGTISEARKKDGSETFAQVELVRLAVPRRVFTLSQIKFAIDRIIWLYEHRDLVGGLAFTEEPKILRFFFGRLKPVSGWQNDIVKAFKNDLHDSL